MDFQGQGKAMSGESEALAIIDAAARYTITRPPRHFFYPEIP
jgi:hypothetical protein